VPRPRASLPLLALAVALGAAACGSSGGDATPTTSRAEAPDPSPTARPLAGRPAAGAKVGQHWHAAFGVDLCGKWLTAPEFHDAVGIHSHGDGLVHIHPFTPAGARRNATMDKFFTGGGWKVTATSFDFGGEATKRNGDTCPDGKPGVVRWAVNGEERDGDLSDFVPFDGDVIALAFLPADVPIPTPPQGAALQQIGDITGG
jgi:hypothetical protein